MKLIFNRDLSRQTQEVKLSSKNGNVNHPKIQVIYIKNCLNELRFNRNF